MPQVGAANAGAGVLPRHVAVGAGTFSTLPSHLSAAERALVVATRRVDIDQVLAAIRGAGCEVTVIRWSGEPDIEAIERTAQDHAGLGPTTVVGIGGGSVLDAAKALAAALANRDNPLIDHLEVVGAGLPLTAPPLPVIAVPTTAGTGSEMTRNAVLDVPSANRKVSLRDPGLVPRVAIIDPDLAVGLPPRVAAACALDATVQLVESYATPFANPLSDLWVRGGVERGLRAAERTVDGDIDDETRLDMAVAAMCSGAALATSKLGTIHGFAGVVGGATGMGHGELCGLFAAPVLRRTIERLGETEPAHPSLERYAELARLAGLSSVAPSALADRFDALVGRADLDAGPIASLGVDDREAIVAATEVASSTAGNPISLTGDDLHDILDTVARRAH